MIKIKIDSEGLPLNRLYPTNKMGRRFLSKEGSEYKKLVQISTLKALYEQGFSFDPEKNYISTEFYFYSPKLKTKQKKLNRKKPDLSNLIKALEDGIFETLGIDDCYNLDIHASYMYADKPTILVILRKHSFPNVIDGMISNDQN
jgi:Holliday junction resolvase RusA-like endonuclease